MSFLSATQLRPATSAPSASAAARAPAPSAEQYLALTDHLTQARAAIRCAPVATFDAAVDEYQRLRAELERLDEQIDWLDEADEAEAAQ